MKPVRVRAPKAWALLATALTLTAGLYAFILHARGAMPSCSALLSEQFSPDRAWVAELYKDYCSVYQEKVVLAIRRVEERSRQKKNVALSLSADSNAVILGWLDNSTIALARSAGATFDLSGPAAFRGIKLAYLDYSDQPTASRDPEKHVVVSRGIDFTSRFDPNDSPVAYPGVSCAMRMSGKDGPDVNDLDIRLYGFKGKPAWGGRFAYLRVILNGAVARPNITAIAVDQLRPADSLYRESTRTQAIWQVSSDGLLQEVAALRKGAFQLKIGYFLDNTEIVYSNRNKIDLVALNEFERCIADNAVFLSST